MKLAILDDYQNLSGKLGDWDRLRRRGVEISTFTEAFASADEAAAKLAPFELVMLMRERTPFPRALSERLPNLRCVTLTGARAPSLDMQALAERRIPVCNTQTGDSSSSTGEIAWGLLISCARDMAKADRGMRAGGWHAGIGGGMILAGKRLGVLGLGKIGARVAGYGKAFGMDVVAWSQNLTAEKAEAAGVKPVSKEELFSSCDAISLHVVLSDRTRGVVGAGELARMKPGAILINTSRGPLVDEKALLAALKERRIVAGLDVFDREPLPADHPLRSMDNVVLAPHLGYVSEEIFRIFYRDTIENFEAFLDGKPIRVINGVGA